MAARLVPGPRGNALTFDGVAELVYVPDADVLDVPGPVTVLAWMRAVPRTEGPRAYPIFDEYAYVDGAWHLYAATWDGAAVEVTVDGEVAATCT